MTMTIAPTSTTTPDEAELWRAYHQTRSDAARNAIAERYLPLLNNVAKLLINRRQLPSEVERDDLIAEGFFGLLEAIGRFDPSRGLKFGTYAQRRIQGAMLDSLRHADWTSRTIRSRTTLKGRIADQLQVRNGRPPSEDELLAALREVDPDNAERIMQTEYRMMFPFSAIEHRRCEDSELRHRDILNLIDPHDRVEAVERRDYFEWLVTRLPPRDQFVLSVLLGGLTFGEIAQRLSRSESLVSQIRTRIIHHARAEFAAA